MRAVVFAVVATAACIRPSDKLTCGDNVCPVSNVCIDNAYCVVPAAVDACGDKAGGQDCTFDDRAGHCVEHSQLVCEPAVCGDNIIDEELHEQCDGTASFAAQCVDLGFDLGHPTCSDQCGLATDSCARFGWTPLLNAPAVEMWTDGTALAYVRRNPDSLEIHGGGLSISQPGSFYQLVGGGGRIYVLSNDQIWTVVNGSLVSLAAPFNASSIFRIVAGDDGTLYVLACGVYAYRNNTWKTLAMDTGCPAHIAVGPSGTGSRVFFELSNVLYEVTGSGTKLIQGFTSPIRQMLVRNVGGREVVVLSQEDGVTLVPTDGAALTKLSTDPMVSIAANERFLYMAQQDGVIQRWDGMTKDRMRTPGPLLTEDPAGHIYAYGGPIYRFSGLDFGELAPPVFGDSTEEMTSMLELPDGSAIAASAFQLLTLDSNGVAWADMGSPLSPNSVRALAGITKSQRFVAGYLYANGTPAVSSLWREDAGSWLDLTPVNDPPFVDGLWMAPSGDVFAAGRFNDGRGFLGQISSSTMSSTGWQAITPPNCEMHGIHARSATHVIAVGACDDAAVVWVYDGTSWSELHREPSIKQPLRGVRLLPSGDIFAVGDGGAIWFTGSTWYVDATVQGRSISGDDNDLWVSGAFTSIQHWDGFQWSRMTTRVLGTTVIAASKARVLMPGAASGHVILVRDER